MCGAFVVAAAALGASCGTATPSALLPPFTQTDLVLGTGAAAGTGQTLTVTYTGYLYDTGVVDGRGPVFDSTAAGSTVTFQLASGTVIDGWVQGIPGMKIGGTRRLVIPPSLAYGATGFPGKIPPNASLIFDITLVDIPPQ